MLYSFSDHLTQQPQKNHSSDKKLMKLKVKEK